MSMQRIPDFRVLLPGPYDHALRSTIAAVRKNPELHKYWFHDLGPRIPEGQALARWLQADTIQKWLRTVPERHQDDAPGNLIQKAADWLADEPARLRVAWAHHQDIFGELIPSARHLASLLFALAMENGPRVILSNRAAAYGITLMGGPSYHPRQIGRAREELDRKGICTVRIGHQWEKGFKSKPTQYDLLPGDLREALESVPIPVSAHTGIGTLHIYPHLTAAQHDALKEKYTELLTRRKNESEPTPLPTVAVVTDLSYLLPGDD